MIKRIISFAVCVSMLLSMALVVSADGFNDLTNEHWCYEAVSNLNSLGYINGYEDNTFGPDNSITRAEFTKLVMEASKKNEDVIKIACIGDSLTQGSIGADGVHVGTESYVEYLSATLGTGYEVKNFGVSSVGINDGHKYFYKKYGAYQQSLDYNPDIVISFFGTNDAKKEYWDDVKDKYADIYKEFIKSYADLESQPKIILAIPSPVFEGEYYEDRPEQNMAEMRQIIKDVAEEMSYLTLDAYSLFLNRPEFFPDGIHWNTKGAIRVSDGLEKIINNIYTKKHEKAGAVKVACVGDSLTAGSYGVENKHTTKESYSKYLGYLLGDGYKVANFGRSSAGICQGQKFYYPDLPEYRASLEYNADIVIILFGTNDATTTYWPEGEAKYADYYKSFIKTYTDLPSNPKIILGLPGPVFRDRGKYTSDKPFENMQSVRQIIKDIGEELSIPVADTYTLLKDKSEYFFDGLHWNIDGAKEVATEFSKIIKGEEQLFFDDVNLGDWFYRPIMDAARQNVVKGDGIYFNPDKEITREDAAVIIYRTLSVAEPVEADKPFDDYDKVSEYAREAVLTLKEKGIISGDNGMFRPSDAITRAEAAMIVNNTLK